jgi:hypothetical protein
MLLNGRHLLCDHVRVTQHFTRDAGPHGALEARLRPEDDQMGGCSPAFRPNPWVREWRVGQSPFTEGTRALPVLVRASIRASQPLHFVALP